MYQDKTQKQGNGKKLIKPEVVIFATVHAAHDEHE